MSRDPAPVCRGVAFLDEHIPGWEKQIDLDTLDLNATDRCVLAQLWLAEHPRTRQRTYAFSRMVKALRLSEEDTDRLGFDVVEADDYDYGDYERRFDRLTKAWQRVIRRRLKAA
jgi:hypothetical protein